MFQVIAVAPMSTDTRSVIILSDFNGRDYAIHRVARSDVAALTGAPLPADEKAARAACTVAANHGYAFGGQYFRHEGEDDYAVLSEAIRAFRARAGDV